MDQKGLIGDVWLNYRILRNWNHGSIRLDDNYLNRLETQEKDGRLGNFYRWNL